MTGTNASAASKPHQRSRVGRIVGYWFVFGVIGAMLCAVGGYMLWMPEYQTTGYIRVRPVIPTLLYKTEDSGVMPMFGAYVQTQVMLIQSQRVIDMAMQDDAWKATGRGASLEAMSQFRDGLTVQSSGGEMIKVTFTDNELPATQAAVKSVIRSYMRTSGEQDIREEAERMRILEERRTALSNQLAGIRKRITEIGNEYGSVDLESTYQFMLEEFHKLERMLREAEFALANEGVAPDKVKTPRKPTPAPTPAATSDGAVDFNAIVGRLAPGPSEVSVGMVSIMAFSPTTDEARADMSVEQLCEEDWVLRSFCEQRDVVESQIKVLGLRYAPEHPEALKAQGVKQAIDEQIEKRVERLRGSDGSDHASQATIEQLQARIYSLRALHEGTKEEVIALGQKSLEIRNLKSEYDLIEERLKETRLRIEQLSVESALGGRIEVVSTGDTSGMPVNLGVRRRQTLLAGVGGWLFFGLLGVIVALRRRDVASPKASTHTAPPAPDTQQQQQPPAESKA